MAAGTTAASFFVAHEFEVKAEASTYSKNIVAQPIGFNKFRKLLQRRRIKCRKRNRRVREALRIQHISKTDVAKENEEPQMEVTGRKNGLALHQTLFSIWKGRTPRVGVTPKGETV